ncbi:MAG: hypothetical protein ACOCXR_03700, partial [Phototrophicaceae bacterium]
MQGDEYRGDKSDLMTRFPIGLTLVAAAAAAALMFVIGTVLIDPPRDLLVNVSVQPETVSPNADGVDDVTLIRYEVTEAAYVSIVFAASDGTAYVFRDREFRDPGARQVQFSGVVNGYTLPDEEIPGDVLRRLMPEGTYIWTLTAEAVEDGEMMSETGRLVLEDADSTLPIISEFSVGPQVFTPNQ